MARLKEKQGIRFPIDGLDLAALAGPDGADATTWSETTSRRRHAKHRAFGLTMAEDAPGERRTAFQRAAAAALAERPDLVTHLPTSSGMALLSSLPDRRPGFPTPTISGLSRPTWNKTLAQLAEAALVLVPAGGARINPRLPALERLVGAYRALYESPPDFPGASAWRPIFQQGVETFWSTGLSSVPDGLTAVGPASGSPMFSALAAPHSIAYLGPRPLDNLDHLLLPLLAEPGSSVEPDMRLAGLLLAVLPAPAFSRKRFHARCAYYGLADVGRFLARSAREYAGPAWLAAERYRKEFGVKEVHSGGRLPWG